MRFHIEPALSFVPDARAPPNGCWPDDRAGGLVVDVEVPRRVAEGRLGLVERGAILREDRSRQAVRRGAVDQVERLGPALLVVDVGRQTGPKISSRIRRKLGRASRSRSGRRSSPCESS